VKGAGLKLFSGVIDLSGLEVRNPEGYTRKNAIEVGHITVRAPLHRLVRSKPRIESIIVEAPVVTLEQGITGSNLSDIMNNAGKPQEKDRGRKIVIGSLRIVSARVPLAAKLMGVPSATISLPTLELKELGGEGNQGVTIAQTMALALWEIVQAAVANGGGILPPDLCKSLSSSIASFDQASQQLLGTVADVGGEAVGAADSAASKLVEGAKGIGGKAEESVFGEKGLPGKMTQGVSDSVRGLIPGRQKK
jgi:uncharacterized protein involved in outer membrane biogenesis